MIGLLHSLDSRICIQRVRSWLKISTEFRKIGACIFLRGQIGLVLYLHASCFISFTVYFLDVINYATSPYLFLQPRKIVLHVPRRVYTQPMRSERHREARDILKHRVCVCVQLRDVYGDLMCFRHIRAHARLRWRHDGILPLAEDSYHAEEVVGGALCGGDEKR